MLLVAFAAVAANAAGFSVTNLRTEYMENPLGLDKPRPRFTWELRANDISKILLCFPLQLCNV